MGACNHGGVGQTGNGGGMYGTYWNWFTNGPLISFLSVIHVRISINNCRHRIVV